MLIMFNITFSDRVEVNGGFKIIIGAGAFVSVTCYSWEVFFSVYSSMFYVWRN